LNTPGLPLSLRFTRLDNGTAVDAAADLSLPAGDPALELLLERFSNGTADAPALRELGRLWQERVRHLLLELAYDAGVFVIRRVERRRVLPNSGFMPLLAENARASASTRPRR